MDKAIDVDCVDESRRLHQQLGRRWVTRQGRPIMAIMLTASVIIVLGFPLYSVFRLGEDDPHGELVPFLVSTVTFFGLVCGLANFLVFRFLRRVYHLTLGALKRLGEQEPICAFRDPKLGVVFIDRNGYFVEKAEEYLEYRAYWDLVRIEYDPQSHILVAGLTGYRSAIKLTPPQHWSRALMRSVMARVQEAREQYLSS